MKISHPDTAESGDVGETRDGIQDLRLLLTGEENAPTNYKLNVSHAVTDWKAPRHRHDFDQFRYVLRGEFIYGKDRVLPEGHVAYFPEGIYYGPQIRVQGLEIILCQLGGASGNGFLNKEQRRKAKEELSKRGTFEKGVYTWVDENGQKHNQDSAEAVAEQAKGAKTVYPAPRYNDIITMDPANFSWVPVKGNPGVERKHLGTFNERESRVGFLKLAEGASFEAGAGDFIELLFLVNGEVDCQGQTCPRQTAFSFEPNEGPIKLTAKSSSEFFCINLPKF